MIGGACSACTVLSTVSERLISYCCLEAALLVVLRRLKAPWVRATATLYEYELKIAASSLGVYNVRMPLKENGRYRSSRVHENPPPKSSFYGLSKLVTKIHGRFLPRAKTSPNLHAI